MTRSRRLYFLLGLAVLLLCAAAAAPRARALWAQLPSGEWIEAADCAARREAPAPGRDALHVRAGMRPARGCTGTVVAELRRPRADGSWEVEASFRAACGWTPDCRARPQRGAACAWCSAHGAAAS